MFLLLFDSQIALACFLAVLVLAVLMTTGPRWGVFQILRSPGYRWRPLWRSTPAALACLVLFILLLPLGACTTDQEKQSATTLASVCKAGAPLITEAQSKVTASDASASSLLTFATSVCNADGTVVASLDPAGQAVDPVWLTDVMKGLQIAAQLAPVILPLVDNHGLAPPDPFVLARL